MLRASAFCAFRPSCASVFGHVRSSSIGKSQSSLLQASARCRHAGSSDAEARFEVWAVNRQKKMAVARPSSSSLFRRRADQSRSNDNPPMPRPATGTTKMANDSLDDMLGWLDEAMGEKDAHHSPTIAVGRAGSSKHYYGRSRSSDEIHHHAHRHHPHHSRAPSRRHYHHNPEDHEVHNDRDDRGYQRASSCSAIDPREMNVSLIEEATNYDTSRVMHVRSRPRETQSNLITPFLCSHLFLGQPVHSCQRR